MELVEMSLGQVISEPGCDLGFAYFPLTAIVSLLYVMNDGESAEIALVGNDGVLGITLFMGGNSTTIRAVVQSAGMGYRLPASELVAEVARGGATLRLRLLYTQSLVTQMTQTAACRPVSRACGAVCQVGAQRRVGERGVAARVYGRIDIGSGQ